MARKPVHYGQRILIVDDDPICCQFCFQTLSVAGFVPYEAHNGPDAIEQASRIQPHVILIDMHIAGITASDILPELSAQLLEKNEFTQFIGMTGDDSTSTYLALHEAGCINVLTKPFTASSLLDSVKGVAEVKSSTGKNRSGSETPALALQAAFLHELRGSLCQVDNLITSLDWKQAANAVHRLTGAAAMTGHWRLEKRCRQLLTLLIQARNQSKTKPHLKPHSAQLIASGYLDFLWGAADLVNLQASQESENHS